MATDVQKVINQIQKMQTDALSRGVLSQILTDVGADLPTLIEEVAMLAETKSPAAAIALGTNLLNLADQIYQLLTGDPPAQPISTSQQVQVGNIQFLTPTEEQNALNLAKAINSGQSLANIAKQNGVVLAPGILLTTESFLGRLGQIIQKIPPEVKLAGLETAVVSFLVYSVIQRLPPQAQDFIKRNPILIE